MGPRRDRSGRAGGRRRGHIVAWRPAPGAGAPRRHYIATRHPDAHPAGTPSDHFTAADASQALADAEQVLEWLQGRWQRLADADAEEGGARQ